MLEVHGPAPHARPSDLRIPCSLVKTCLEGPDIPVLTTALTGESWSSHELAYIVPRLAQILHEEHGITEHSRVLFYSTNSALFAIAKFALSWLGAVVVQCSYSATVDELQYYAGISDSNCAITDEDRIVALNTACGFQKTFTFYRTNLSVPSIQALCAKARRGRPCDALRPTDVQCCLEVVFSSGTTGQPKAVAVNHSVFNACVAQMSHPCYGTWTSHKMLVPIPLYHSYGSIITIWGILCGMNVHVLANYTKDRFLLALERHQITTTHLAPPIAAMLASDPSVDSYDLSKLVNIFTGASPLDPTVSHTLVERLKLQDLRQLHGMSETTILFMPPQWSEKYKRTSIGPPVPGCTAVVKDPETGKRLPANTLGEICAKGPQIQTSYYKNPTATREFFDAEGFAHTGDLGYFDENGYFYVVERMKEVMKYKGTQVAPSEIEKVIATHPSVEDCAVVGKRDQIADELPAAFVVKRAGTGVTEDEIHALVNQHVASYKRLRGGIYFTDVIPRNVSGKLQRHILRKKLNAETLAKL